MNDQVRDSQTQDNQTQPSIDTEILPQRLELASRSLGNIATMVLQYGGQLEISSVGHARQLKVEFLGHSETVDLLPASDISKVDGIPDAGISIREKLLYRKFGPIGPEAIESLHCLEIKLPSLVRQRSQS